MIRVLQIIHGRHFGGGEKVVVDLATGLDRNRFRVGVVCLSRGRLLDQLTEAGVSAGYMPMLGKYDFRVLSTLKSLVNEKKIDILHSHTSRTNFLARMISRKTSIVNVNTVQSPIMRDTNQTLKSLPLNARVDRWMAGMSDAFAAVSEDTAAYLSDQGIPRDKIHVIYNGAVVPATAPTPEERKAARTELEIPNDVPLLGMVAQLRPRKGAEYLILAAQHVQHFYPDAQIVFVGNAEFVEGRDYLTELQQLAARKGVGGMCRFVGFQPNVSAWLTAFDVMVLPSLLGEGLPLSLLEGMAHGLPIVTTDTEGNRNCITDSREGFLVSPRDALGLGERLVQLIQSSEMREEMGAAAYATARDKFSMEKMLCAYSDLYERLVNK